jgi:hypothetical protein
MAILKSIGITFLKFLRVYPLTLIVGAIFAQSETHFNAFTPGIDIGSSVGILLGRAIGFGGPAAIIGLVVELVVTRKFEGPMFFYVSLIVMFLPWLAEHFSKILHLPAALV